MATLVPGVCGPELHGKDDCGGPDANRHRSPGLTVWRLRPARHWGQRCALQHSRRRRIIQPVDRGVDRRAGRAIYAGAVARAAQDRHRGGFELEAHRRETKKNVTI